MLRLSRMRTGGPEVVSWMQVALAQAQRGELARLDAEAQQLKRKALHVLQQLASLRHRVEQERTAVAERKQHLQGALSQVSLCPQVFLIDSTVHSRRLGTHAFTAIPMSHCSLGTPRSWNTKMAPGSGSTCWQCLSAP